MGANCHGCDVKLRATRACHCSAEGCHRTFSGLLLFDRHRRGGHCHDPANLKDGEGQPLMRLDTKRNVWVGYSETDWADVFKKGAK